MILDDDCWFVDIIGGRINHNTGRLSYCHMPFTCQSCRQNIGKIKSKIPISPVYQTISEYTVYSKFTVIV